MNWTKEQYETFTKRTEQTEQRQKHPKYQNQSICRGVLTIGIDGDVNKSGVCVWKKSTKTIELLTLTFFELFDYFRENKNNIELVKIESGWLNKKSNFHGSKNNQTAARIGSHVGANHETGKKIVEMCQYLELQYREVKPPKKTWKGGKISHVELKKLTSYRGITMPEKSNRKIS